LRLLSSSFNSTAKAVRGFSELLPHTAKMVDDLAIIRTVHTEAINHEPAITFIQTGNMIAGKLCLGAWVANGLGSMNQDLPTFVVLNVTHSYPKAGVQAISPDCGARISVGAILGRGASFWRGSGPLYQQSGGRFLVAKAADAGRNGPDQPNSVPEDERSRNPHARGSV
jgi:hypothetical protein